MNPHITELVLAIVIAALIERSAPANSERGAGLNKVMAAYRP